MTEYRKCMNTSSRRKLAAECSAKWGNVCCSESVEEQIFLTAYVLWLAASVLDITKWRSIGPMPQVIDYVKYTAYILLIIRFLLKRSYGRKDVAGIFLILSGCILAEHSIYSRQIIPVVFFVYFSADVRFEKILKCTLAVQAAILVITAAASGLGIIEDELWYEGDRIRHSLGYTYCGYPAHLMFFISMIWLCIRRRAHLADACVLLLLNYLVYWLTDSRTDFMLSVLGVMGAFLCGDPRTKARRPVLRRPRTEDARERRPSGRGSAVKNRLIRIRDFLLGALARYGYFLAFVFSLIVHYFYNQENAFQFQLNEMLNGRLQFGNTAIRTYGFSLFGRAIRWFGKGSLQANPSRTYNYVDSSFLKELLSYGWIFSILLIVGFYLTGKLLAQQKEWMLCWAMLVSLAYALLNAHLLVLTFNVFILLLGKLFAKETDSEPEEPLAVRETDSEPEEPLAVRETDSESEEPLAVRETDSELEEPLTVCGIRADVCRRILRCGLFIGILCDTILVQNLSTSDQLQYARMHIWIISAMLFAITVLCAQEPAARIQKTGTSLRENGLRVRRTPELLRRLLLLFLLLACISDFLVSKKFRYAAFAMLAFGGMFQTVWNRMRAPEKLLEEFKLACKILFAVVSVYCILARPAVPGIHYTGMYTDSIAFGCFALIALVVFLSDHIQAGSRGMLRSVFNGMAAAVALYFIWMTQQITIAAAAALIGFVYLICWLRVWMTAKSGKERVRQVLNLIIAAVLGAALVLAVRAAIYHAAFALGTQVVYENDKVVEITESVPSLLSGGGWKDVLLSKWENARAYLENLNIIGNKNRLKIDGKRQWAQNSILMVAYRYGIPAGVVYAGMLAAFLWSGVAVGFRKKNFFIMGGAVACMVVCMLEAVEMPFIRLIWLMFYFVAGCTMAFDGKGTDLKKKV